MDERAPLPRTSAEPGPGPALLLAPHADDDVIGAGGAACLHAARGDAVHVVVAFDGTAGDPDGRFDAAELAARREREARAGGAHLGLEDYRFLGHPEGHEPGPGELAAAARQVAALVEELAPRTVYAPWIGEHHLDHHSLCRAARLGLELAGFDGEAWGFEVWTPLVPTWILDVTSVMDRKVAALREHTSQIEYGDLVHEALGMQAQRALYLAKDARYGEAFRPLGPASAADRAATGVGG